MESLPQEIAHYEKLIKVETEELKQLQVKLHSWEQEMDNLEADVAHYRKLYEKEALSYRNLRNDLINTRIELDHLQNQLAFYREARDSLEEEVKKLQTFIGRNRIIEKQLEQRVNDIQKTYEMLAAKYEEARITEAQKTSDVKFIARAVPPARPLGNRARLNMAIAGILAFMIGVFVVFLREFLKEEEN